jgi:hypothetical protein
VRWTYDASEGLPGFRRKRTLRLQPSQFRAVLRFTLSLFNRLFPALALGVVLTGSLATLEAATSSWVHTDASGRLVYRADERGNTIPDYSRAGYGGGGVRLPEVSVVVRLAPQAQGDDGARIQAAIDEVSRRPVDARGFRGAVLLQRGTFRVAESLAIREGGVVLRGEGRDMARGGTEIIATGKKKRTLIEIGLARGPGRREIDGTRRRITDAYVPWSARSFSVDTSAGYKVGDRIVVHRPSTAAWISAIGMDRIKPRPGADPAETKQWKAGDYDLHFERTVVAIDGNRITLDAPVMNALDAQYGGGSIYQYTFPRLVEAGVEHLRLVSEYERGKETSDEDHAWTGIDLGAVENAWVRDVTFVHFSHAVDADRNALFFTLQDLEHLDPVSLLTGSRRYSFGLNGQYGLAQRCFARGARHTFVNGSRALGPNVFLDGQAVQAHADSGPHHRWSVGTLYDNISDDNQLRVQDRQYSGSGHGWAGVQQVFWNCTSKSLVVQAPPTAQNWAIGCVGEFVKGSWAPDAPLGIVEATGTPVRPRSLYLAQLEARMGPPAVANIARAPAR